MDWLFYLMLAISAVAGYFLGNISTGYIISMAISRKDVRKYGSHSAGSTNMMRMYGAGVGAATFAGDVLKGAIAAFIGLILAGEVGGLAGGLAAVAGHNWPALLKFRGGKGIATTAGMLLVLFPKETAVLLAASIILIAITRIVSIGSLVGVLMITLAVIFHTANGVPNTITGLSNGVNLFSLTRSLPGSIIQLAIYIGMGLLFVMAYVSHRENLKRLFTGTERRIKLRKTPKLQKPTNLDQESEMDTPDIEQKKVITH